MVDVFIVIYCVCCITIMAMCGTSVVYMIRDMIADSRMTETDDETDEDVTGDA